MNTQPKPVKGIFLGLCTLDVLQLVDTFPTQNQKVRAAEMALAAGGPATNAAVIFAKLGGQTDLITKLSKGTIGQIIHADLAAYDVNLQVIPKPYTTTVASIIVTSKTGDRAVVSAGDSCAPNQQIPNPTTISLPVLNNLSAYHTLCVDGYHTDTALPILQSYHDATNKGFSILDAGSYKPDTEDILPHLDCVVASANFALPGSNANSPKEIFEYLHDFGIKYAAITQGEKPILASVDGISLEIPVSVVPNVIDTLGAGDFFHGAFAYAIAKTTGNCAEPGHKSLTLNNFKNALAFASRIAARSITSFGSRAWLTNI